VKLRTIRSREELLAVLRERQAELNISCGTLEGLTLLADGYVSKLISLTPAKQIGPIALGALLGALALKIVRIEIAEDPEAAAKVASRWTPRKRRPNRKKLPVWCVVTNGSEVQPSFKFANPDREQSPDVDDQPADHDAC
jgi:hypothetical protein